MQLEVGSIVEGKVTGITKFGAFIELEGGKTGMVHISEIAATYVKEISDYLSMNQMVKVKVLNISDDGKISLSVKRAQDRPQATARRTGPGNFDWNSSRRGAQNSGPMSFEDMMSKFKQASDDKMSDLRKYMDVKRGSANRKGGQPR